MCYNLKCAFCSNCWRKNTREEAQLSAKDDFDFLNSPLWLQYTQHRYLSPDEIKYRQSKSGAKDSDWSGAARKIVTTRKTGSVTLFLNSIEPRFWFYPADIINKKVDQIELLGKRLFEQINAQSNFKNDFLLDSRIEEAITSAIYEGAHSTRAQAEQLIASGKRPTNKDEWMLVNNVRAMQWVQENRDKPISKEIILQLHKIVTHNTLEGDDVNFSGRFRNDKIFVGPHEGVKHELIESTIQEAIQITSNNPRYIHPLLKGILVHYFIAFIHPFFDGNGRTARALFYFKAMRNELSYIELLSVSAYLKDHGARYEKAFEKVVANDYDVTYFIDFCLDSIHSALVEVSRKVAYLLRINDLRSSHGLTSQQVGLLQRMALHKFRKVSIEEYADQIDKSREFARLELKKLADLNFIEEKKESKKLVYTVNANKLKELFKDATPEKPFQA